MTRLGGRTCPECGSKLVPSLTGAKCPKLNACGRGGVEETTTGGSDRSTKGIKAARVSRDGARA